MPPPSPHLWWGGGEGTGPNLSPGGDPQHRGDTVLHSPPGAVGMALPFGEGQDWDPHWPQPRHTLG